MTNDGEPLQVIVTANGPQIALDAVATVGGVVTSDLWLIDAVGAEISSDGIEELIHFPGIVSIVDNNSIATSGDEPGQNNPNPSSFKRRWQTQNDVGDDIELPAISLPNGNMVVVSKKGIVIFLAPNGTEIKRVDLDQDALNVAPAVGVNGEVYLATKDKRIFAMDSTGEILWVNRLRKDVQSDLVLNQSSDTPTLYFIDEKENLIALDSSTGATKWFYSLRKYDTPTAPSIDVNNQLFIVDKKGRLVALKDNGNKAEQIWSSSKLTKEDAFKTSPMMTAQGNFFIVSGKEEVVGVSPEGEKLEYP